MKMISEPLLIAVTSAPLLAILMLAVVYFMGMFDYFHIDNKWIPKEKQLPQDKQDYQTKDFECYLETYEVLENGSLVRNVCDEGEIMGSKNIVPYIYTGGFRFYNTNDEFAAWCVNGVVKDVVVVR